jgi:hypothetical protein
MGVRRQSYQRAQEKALRIPAGHDCQSVHFEVTSVLIQKLVADFLAARMK